MLRVTDEIKALFKADNVHKELVITIPEADITLENEDILTESMNLYEAIETGNNLTFTGCIASKFEIETRDIVQSIQEMAISVDMYLPDEEDPIPIFNGYIDTMTNTSHEEYNTKLTCYDALYRINNADVTAWYNGLSFPISIKNMRDSFFQYLGITQVADYLVNDAFMVNKTITDAVISGEVIIKNICQINGRYGRINREGKFQYVHLVEGTEAIYPREDLFPADDLYPSAENASDNVNKAHYKSISFENYRVTPISKVQLVDEEGQIIATSGTGTNPFTLKDNPLIWGKTASQLSGVAQNLYNEIHGLWYIPANVTCIGLPYVECGDFVLMACRRSIVRAYVLERTLKGIQTLEDDYRASGEIKQPVYKPTLKQQVTANSVAISNETSRATNAETSEYNRARSAENTLNNAIGSVNNRVSGVYSELVDTQRLVATKASVQDLQVTNELIATKADISTLNTVNAKIDNLAARAITTDNLRAQIGGFSSIYMNTLYVNDVYITGNGGNLPDKVRQWA